MRRTLALFKFVLAVSSFIAFSSHAEPAPTGESRDAQALLRTIQSAAQKLNYSGTFVYQQWPYNPETPHGAWDFHETLIPKSPKKPLRIWMHVSDRDNLITRDNYHDWVLANENMARVLAAKGYPYQFVFAKNAGHCDRSVKAQTLPLALEYVWQGYAKK